MIKSLMERLKGDREFFDRYEESFTESFAAHMETSEGISLSRSALRTIGVKVYRTLFTFKEDPTEELYRFALKVAENEIDIKPVFSKAFLIMAKDFVDYLIERDEDIDRLKTFISLIDEYLSTIERAYLDYVNSLRREVKELKNEREREQEEIILHLIRKLKTLKLLSFFKQIPVTCKVNVKGVAGGRVRIDVKGCSRGIIYEGGSLFLKVPSAPKPVMATLEEVNFEEDSAFLKGFRFTEIPQERRRFVRVEPSSVVRVVVGDAEGEMADLSIGGVGVRFFAEPLIGAGERVKVSFEVDGKEVGLEGEVRYVISEDGRFRVGIEFIETSRAEELLADYIMRRQFEILKELRAL